MSEKKPRLFYWDEGVDSWLPAPERVADLIDLESFMSQHNQPVRIRFRRVDMTDEEFDALPDA